VLKVAAFAMVMLSGIANAETLICPVGGERFAAPEAPSCGEFRGQTMLLMPAGCPPDPLPQCPQNFLPMYKMFSAEELGLLAPFMQSESYESNVDFSPYYLAYITEKYLNGADKQLPALLLLWGLWQDPSLISQDPAYMDALNSEIEANILPATGDDNARLFAMLAFTRLLAGHAEDGQSYFAQAESQNIQLAETRLYLEAVRGCFDDLRATHCAAEALIPQD